MPTAKQVHDVLTKRFTPEQLRQAADALEIIIAAVDTVAATHQTNPALTAHGEAKHK